MVQILDTTLRDGSYVANFQFNARDTAILAAGLDAAGVPFIEVGHGLGLNAGTYANMKSPCLDEQYIEACQHAVRRNRWGMFFIPGIGRLVDIDLAARYGMHFVRVGTNVTNIKDAEPFIHRAKEYGMYVASNLMKTYAVTPAEVGRQAATAASYGADIVFVVDSAGGMLPEDVDRYIAAIRNTSDIAIGFHGHNNLGLGVANALRAVELGCAIVDTSIRGLGRSSGNTVTEILLSALKRKGIETGIDITRILDIAESIVDPLLINYKQVDSIGIISGYAQFHSAHLNKIMHYAKLYRIDPRELIVRVSTIDRVDVTNELVEMIAVEMTKNSSNDHRQLRVQLPDLPNRFQSSDVGKQATLVAKECQSIALKFNLISVFNIVQAYRPGFTNSVSPVIHQGTGFIVGSAEVHDEKSAKAIAMSTDGMVDYVLVDIDKKNRFSDIIILTIKKYINQSCKLFYSDVNVWTDAIVELIIELIKGNFIDKSIIVYGENLISKLLMEKLTVLSDKKNIIHQITSSVKIQAIDRENIIIYCVPSDGNLPQNILQNTIIIDALIGSFSDNEIKILHHKGVKLLRVDMHLQIHSILASLIGLSKLVNGSLGYGEIEGVLVASGGIIARRGTVIVDSFVSPSKAFGVADGKGFLLGDKDLPPSLRENLRKVETTIFSKGL